MSAATRPRVLLALALCGALIAGIVAPGCGGCGGGKAALGYVPHDAIVVFVIPSIKDLLQKQGQYLEKFTSDKKVAKALRKMTKNLKRELGFDPTRHEALKAAGLDPDSALAGGLSGDGKNLCLAMGVDDQPTLEKTLRKMVKKNISDDKAKFKKVERDGVTATRVTIEDSDREVFAWGYHKGQIITCLMAEDNELVDQVIRTTKLDKNILENNRYKALSKKLSGQQLKVVVEGKSLASFIEEWVDNQTSGMSKWRKKSFRQNWNTVINSMDYFFGAVAGIKISKDDLLISTFWGIPKKESKKMVERFRGQGDSRQLVKYIGKGALGVAKMSINVKEYLDWQMEVLPADSRKGISRVFKEIKRETKIDVEEDVLEYLAGRFAAGYFLPSKKKRKKAKTSDNPGDQMLGKVDGVVIAEVTNTDEVKDLFKKIRKIAEQEGAVVKKKTRNKRKHYYLYLGDKKVLGWTLVDKLVVLGTPRRLSETIQLIVKGGESVLDSDLNERGKSALKAEENTVFHFRMSKLRKKDLPEKLREYSKLIKKLSDFTVSVAVDEEGFHYEIDGLGLLAAVAIPSFTKYTNRAKTVEATEALDKIKGGARQYYVTDHWDSNGNLLPKGFPNVSGHGRWTPAKSSCKKRLTPTTRWDKDGWGPIHFALTEPHYYQYKFVAPSTTGTGAVYTATARGDLDCDGKFSTFELRGSIDNEGSVKVIGPIISNEME